MKKINSIVLALVLLILSIMSLCSCEKKELITTVGVVEYVKSRENHYVYLRPFEQGDNGVWIPIIVNKKTETTSTFNTDLKNMPELAIGSVVEVVYNVAAPKDLPSFGYEAVSMHSVDKPEMSGKQKSPLHLAEGYSHPDGEIGPVDFGTVVHVSKIETPINGYLIYLEDAKYDDGQRLTMYFLDGEVIERDSSITFKSEEIKGLIESFETGYKIAVFGMKQYPFENLNAKSVLYVDVYDPSYHW